MWGQWKSQDGRPDLDGIRKSLLEVMEATGSELFWVDGRCIIQHEDMDQARELPRMGQYYGGAAFTLVLLPDVTEPQRTPNPIPWQVIDADAHRKTNKRLLQQYIQCQWLKRIWTMQEAWLARKLVFKTYGARGGLVRGDYLELLRTTGPVIGRYGPVPFCLEWMNIGPTLVIGACTGDLITPHETPTLLTRPAGSLSQNNDGRELQSRTTSLYRALRLCNGRGCDPKMPSGKLIGLLGMVDQGDKLTAETVQAATSEDRPPEGNPEQAFRLAVSMRMLGPEVLLCRSRSMEPGCSWLPNLRDRPDGVDLPYISSHVIGTPPAMSVSEDGATVMALEAELTEIKSLESGRTTWESGEKWYKYICTVQVPSGYRSKPTIARRATTQSVESVKKRQRNVLMLQRPSKKGALITVRGHPRIGDFYERKQGFLLFLTDEDNATPLEDDCRKHYRQRIIS